MKTAAKVALALLLAIIAMPFVAGSALASTSGPGGNGLAEPAVDPTPCRDPASPARRFYLDAVRGDDAADGRTPATAWRTLSAAFHGGRLAPGLAYGTEFVLADGDYGALSLTGLLDRAPAPAAGNAAYISLVAAPGNRPVLASLTVRGAERLMVRGLRFQPPAGPPQTRPLIRMLGAPGAELRDIRLIGNELSSRGEVDGWSQTDWQARAPGSAIMVTGARDARCVVIADNTIHGVGIGILLTGDDGRIIGNRIRDFALDAIDFAGNRLEIAGNIAQDNYSLGTGNHNDMIQGLRGPEDDTSVRTADGRLVPGASTWYDVRIIGNLLIRQGRPGIRVPGAVQGISGFAGNWVRLVVANNVVVIGGSRHVPDGDFYDSTGKADQPFSLYRSCWGTNLWQHEPADPDVTAQNVRTMPPERLGWRPACYIHAVTFGSVRHGAIFNNTLVSDNPTMNLVGVTINARNVGGVETCDTIVANNLVTGMMLQSLAGSLVERAPSGTAERDDACAPGRIRNFAAGNLALAPLLARGADLSLVFRDYTGFRNGDRFSWDLHLRPGSPAIGAGNAAMARVVSALPPGTDIEGRPRKDTDIGAYTF
jgi:hypothetical protein